MAEQTISEASEETSTTNAIKKFRRQVQLSSTNVSLLPCSESHQSKICYPGISPQSIDIYGNPDTVSLIRIGRVAHQVACSYPGRDNRLFLDTDKLKKEGVGRLTFVAASHYTVHKYIWYWKEENTKAANFDPGQCAWVCFEEKVLDNRPVRKYLSPISHSFAYNADLKKYPLMITLEPGFVGISTFSIVTTIRLPIGEVMFTAVNQLILVDPSTHQSTSLPEVWREEYFPLCVLKKPLRIDKQSPEGLSTFGEQSTPTSRRIVCWSDVDNNNRTNHSSYIKFALDAVFPAVRKGHLEPFLIEENLKMGVSEVKVIYLGESCEGDMVHIELFRLLPEVPCTVLCSIENSGQVISEVTVTFRPHPGQYHSAV